MKTLVWVLLLRGYPNCMDVVVGGRHIARNAAMVAVPVSAIDQLLCRQFHHFA